MVRHTLEQNLDLAAALGRVEQARAAAHEAGAQLLPSIDLSAQARRQRQSLESPAGAIARHLPGYDRNQSLYDVGAAASWEADLFGGLGRAAEAASAEAQAAEAARLGTRISVAADAADAYFRILGDQARIAVANDQVATDMRGQSSGRIVNVSSVLGFLPAPYMGLYSASKHAVEGLSETLDHEVRNFGIRVALVEPSFTKTNLDINAPQAASKIAAYDTERSAVTRAIQKNVQKAPEPDRVATTIVEAALGPWKMRHTPKGEAALLRNLRRFMPAGPVGKGLRKTFALS
ncbi:MAG: SDR family NAD(P)-dependent oxidoreductase [Telmatospirillum sp.]|nr:SDR family NAD(P)-dependent oxidoreductase [Telmatospirillum sp.]